jgi:2-polyprenyl-3-methyl-5-hydroxy-6-metoxy-1,4-benzoquinol methylase
MLDDGPPKFREHEIEWDDKKISRLWDYYSRTPPYSDAYFSKLFGHHMLRKSGLPLMEPLEVLDFGCGPGYIWDHLVRLGAQWTYTALDFSLESVDQITKKAAGHARFRGAKHVTRLPVDIPGSHFDVVLLLEVVEHLTDDKLEPTINEVARLLKPGGVVLITTPNEEDLAEARKFCPECGAVFHEWQHVRSWTIGTLAGYMRKCGFRTRLCKALDFTAQDISAKGLFRRAKQVARYLFAGQSARPHMIAVFQKD